MVMIWSQKMTDSFLTAIAVDGVDHLLHFLSCAAVWLTSSKMAPWRSVAEARPDEHGPEWFPHASNTSCLPVDLLECAPDFGVQVHFASIQRVLYFVDGAKIHAFALHAFTHPSKYSTDQGSYPATER